MPDDPIPPCPCGGSSEERQTESLLQIRCRRCGRFVRSTVEYRDVALSVWSMRELGGETDWFADIVAKAYGPIVTSSEGVRRTHIDE